MEVLLWVLSAALVASVGAEVDESNVEPLQGFYHEAVGIAAAERIRRAEAAANGTAGGQRIAGGLTTALGEHPYMGGLVISLTTGDISVCGSSLVSPTRLVTAAQCWWDGRLQARQFLVVLGSTRLFSGGLRLTTNRVETHSDWNPNTFANDIALITVSLVTYTSVIGPVALPNGPLLNHDFSQWWAVAVGYGITGVGAGGAITAEQGLSHVNMRVITNVACVTWYSAVRDSTLCARSDAVGRGVCVGDTGGPLLYTDGVRPVLIGIKSFGRVTSCTANEAIAFARVSSFNSWIRSRI